MFVRPCWRPSSEQDAIELIEKNPWALLVSNGADGPMATNLPLLFDHKRSDKKCIDRAYCTGERTCGISE